MDVNVTGNVEAYGSSDVYGVYAIAETHGRKSDDPSVMEKGNADTSVTTNGSIIASTKIEEFNYDFAEYYYGQDLQYHVFGIDAETSAYDSSDANITINVLGNDETSGNIISEAETLVPATE